ncbi:MAG: patatin-like phospholipase family protein [Rhizobiaceae bacterium]|jgi:NTE family protein|nr:patatin-like phospholipase family protein [Rhizobiaceae bacterium]
MIRALKTKIPARKKAEPATALESAAVQSQPVVQPRSGPSVAVALGGGGARGIAHIHALSALDELGIRPVAVSGTSIGALIGAGYAAGMSGADLAAYFRKTLGNRAEVMARLIRMRPRAFFGSFKEGLRPGRIDLEAVLDVFLPEGLPATFEALNLPLMTVATDYYGQRATVSRSGALKPAIAGSAAIPALFHPVFHHGRILVDGGITNPVPFDLVEGLADITLAIDVVGGPSGPPDRMPSTIDTLFGASQLMMQAIIAEKLKAHKPDIFLRPDVDAWRVMDFLKVREILEKTAPFKDEVKRAVDQAFTRKIKS